MRLSVMRTKEAIVVVDPTDGFRETMSSEDPRFEEVVLAVQEAEDAEGIARVKAIFRQNTAKFSNIAGVEVEHGLVKINGKTVPSSLNEHLLQLNEEGDESGVQVLVKFWENTQNNPSRNSVQCLHRFVSANHITFDEDGCFIAYKVIKNNWKDKYTGKIDNSITGIPVSMPRNEVEDNPNHTCSAGLHVCSWEYTQGFYGGGDDRIVMVKVKPEHVVAVPTDYQNTKMRVCEYTVLCEIDAALKESLYSKWVESQKVDDDENEEYGSCPECGEDASWGECDLCGHEDFENDDSDDDDDPNQAFGDMFGYTGG